MLFQAPNPIIWQWGFISIRWYALIVTLAVFFAIQLAQILAKYRGINPRQIGKLAIWLIPSSLLGARLFYVFFNPLSTLTSPLQILAIHNGGLSVYGALLAGLITTVIFARYYQISLGKLADIIAPSLAMAQTIGLWGHFFNNEAFGWPTNVKWRLYIPISQRPDSLLDYQYFHPNFLYESLLNLVIFLVLISILFWEIKRHKSLKEGMLWSIYVILFALGKFWVESFQIYHLQLGTFKIYLLVNSVLLMFGIISLLIFSHKKFFSS
jgi:phosphatidylglycerol:prolipoprotein diacylglycerol transferase